MAKREGDGFPRGDAGERELMDAMYKWYVYSYRVMSPMYQGDYRALVYLMDHGKGQGTPSELAEMLGVTRQRVTVLLSGMRNKGLVRMEQDPEDRRRQLIRVTQAGRDFVLCQFETFQQAFAYMRERLGDGGVHQFVEFIDKLIPEEGEE